MKTFNINGISKPISVLGLGTMIFGQDSKERDFALLDKFVELGGTYVDTAEVYGSVEERGYSEQVIGEWLQANPHKREDIVLCSKGLITDYCKPLYGDDGAQITPENIRKAISGSLQRLQTEYLDIWMFHRDNLSVGVEDLMDALHEEVTSGRIRTFGASNWSIERIEEANAYARSRGQTELSSSSPNFSLAIPQEVFWPDTQTVNEESRKWFVENNFPLMAWSSLGRGFFTLGDPADTSDADLVRTYYNDSNFERKARAERLARAKGLTMFEVALAYVINQPFPVVALNGAETVAQLESSIKACGVKLTDQERDWLDLSSSIEPEVLLVVEGA